MYRIVLPSLYVTFYILFAAIGKAELAAKMVNHFALMGHLRYIFLLLWKENERLAN